MVRLQFSVELNYEVAPPGGDFIFNVHAAHTQQQIVQGERGSSRPWNTCELWLFDSVSEFGAREASGACFASTRTIC